MNSRILIVLAVFLPIAVTAQTNMQKSFPLRSGEFEALRTLSIEQGIALPFTSGPIPEAELRHAMDRIDTGALSEAGRTTWDWLRESLSPREDYAEEGGRFRFEAGAEFTLETYLHTDPDNGYMEYRWEDRAPVARFPLEFWFGRQAYAIFDLSVQKNIPDFNLYPTYSSSSQYGFDEYSTDEEDPWTNVPYVISTIDVQFPHRAFLSAGGERWNARIGRDQVDWGNGHTGNLYISDYADWYDSLQFSTFWDRFKFSWIWASLDGKLMNDEREFTEYTVGWDTTGDGIADTYVDPGDGSPRIVTYTPDIEQKNLIAQRWEMRVRDRLGLVYTEGIILGRTQVELRHLNPLYHYHNLYTNTQNVGNAHRSFEFNYAVAPGFSFYAAMSPDQWSSPLEPETDIGEEPNAVAYLAGIDYRRGISDGYLHAIVEGVYATPWFGIHNSPLTSITTRRFIMAEHGVERAQIWYDKPIGHYGGNDFALLWMDVSYGVAGRYRYGLNGFYEGDGSVPMNALLQSKVSDDLRDVLSLDDASLSAPSDGYDGALAQWRTAVTVYGEMEPWNLAGFNNPATRRTLSVSSELSAQWMKNRYHQEHDWQFDLQWAMSTTIGL